MRRVETSPPKTIEFTPEAQGPITVQCTMNMYQGTPVPESTLQADPPQ
jgi:plastocyanin domain-containing protein